MTYAERNGLTIDEWIETEVSSRKSTQERRVDELVSRLKRKDVLLVGEVSRLARSMRETLNIMHELKNKKVNVHFVKQGLQTNGESNAMQDMLMANISFAAQMERDLISQRTKAALAQKKANGVKLGNPNIQELIDNKKAHADQYAEQFRSFLRKCIDDGMSQRKIVDAMNLDGLKTPKGKAWSLLQLQKTLKRLNLKTSRSK